MTNNGGKIDKFVKEEFNEDVNVVVGNGSGSQRYNELQIGKVIDGKVKIGDQGSLSHWDRFLHVGSIKVMLVENDDCTRHIVTALLRNCNYEVIQAADGYQAWKILQDLSNHIDIVLTEVVMPSFSGVGLLCKIMSHHTRKHIPVIMMSSHDSMGLVFKCLSKGAVDFLLKPIRKNELKNLWQHVWRRCHSCSGSGSESGTNAQKSVNSKRSNNMVGDDIGSSDDGSGSQSSWTKQAVELESPQASSPCDQTIDHPDSTCALVIHSDETPETMVFRNQEGHTDNIVTDKELVVGGSNQLEMQTTIAVKASNEHNGMEHQQDFDPTKNMRVNVDMNTKIMDDSRETVTALSLKRPREEVKEVQNGHNILGHSELSAFTRYNTNSNNIRTRITSSSSQVENMKKESTRDTHSDGFLICQGSNEQATPAKTGDNPPPDSVDPPRVHHVHHHHHVHHYHNVGPKQQPLANHDDSGLKELAATAPHCGSSNVFGERVEGNVDDYGLNTSASGSKHGSNGRNVESGGGLTKKSGGDGSGSGSENRIDQHKSAQGEVVVMKFREKTKDRCFQKKGAISKKKLLAEQRPRVRGQSVKQTGRESSSNC